MSITILKGLPQDAEALLSLYRRQIGLPGCSWNAFYPSLDNVREDLAASALYLLFENDTLLAAASCGPFHELDHLPFWSPAAAPFELARVCVEPSRQGQGLAAALLSALLADVRRRGCDSVRLLAGENHPAALRLYERAGFIRRGAAREYDLDFFAYDISLKQEDAL